jgi:hypothetical protein
MFVLFSNRLGCLGSLLVSALLTLVLLLVFDVLWRVPHRPIHARWLTPDLAAASVIGMSYSITAW